MTIIIQFGRGGKYEVTLRDPMKTELQAFSIILLHKYFHKFQIWKKGWHRNKFQSFIFLVKLMDEIK